jgi:threonine dehydrogenase-like Zn-dependent dehydrogenase
MCVRVARQFGIDRVIAVDLVPERLEAARRYGAETIDRSSVKGVPDAIRELTDGRGPDGVIDAVGMEAHGAPLAALAQKAASLLPDAVSAPLTERAGVDRLRALYEAIDAVRRGGTVSITGVYGGTLDPLPMMELFDKQIRITMGQANVRRWVDDILPLLTEEDPLATSDLATHVLPLDDAPKAYETFQEKRDGAIKIVLQP